MIKMINTIFDLLIRCEGARLCMNPMGNKFDLAKAEQFLEYAIFFTPQYGDSFVEALRLYSILGDRLAIK